MSFDGDESKGCHFVLSFEERPRWVRHMDQSV